MKTKYYIIYFIDDKNYETTNEKTKFYDVFSSDDLDNADYTTCIYSTDLNEKFTKDISKDGLPISNEEKPFAKEISKEEAFLHAL